MATTIDSPRGFIATRKQDGQAPGRAKLYPTGGRNVRAIFAGDPVFLDGNGELQVATGVSANAPALLGVVEAVYDSNRRPFTHSLPANGQFIRASTAGFAAVYDDPDIVFEIQADATASAGHVTQFVAATVGTPVTAAGTSGFKLEMAEATATSVGHPYKIIGIAGRELDRIPGANNKVEVVITNHVWRRHDRNNVI